MVVPGRLLVQSWRGNVRREDDLDSNFDADGPVIQMVHVGVPPQFEARWSKFTDSWAAWCASNFRLYCSLSPQWITTAASDWLNEKNRY